VKALVVEPGVEDSARLDDIPEPDQGEGVVVQTLSVGVCGTDREILAGAYGDPPQGADRLVLGHEAVGKLEDGALVVPIVRCPDPVPCPACAMGEWDMCENGRYTEHGISGADGFLRERFVTDPSRLVPVPDDLGAMAVLVEPTSVVAKAWDHVERIGNRATWNPKVALITGAGPVGLLAALLARQRGLETHVFDRVTDGPKPDLVAALGATYHVGDLDDAGPEPDVVIDCTGAGSVVLDVIGRLGRNGIVCLAGVSTRARPLPVDAAALNRHLVLENQVIVGTVNANRRHYEAAVQALVDADRSWLAGVITRSVPLDRWSEALERRDDDVKVVIEVGDVDG
jgi:threonine dehydrogenase-like Zn-dependent dehydrogenase